MPFGTTSKSNTATENPGWIRHGRKSSSDWLRVDARSLGIDVDRDAQERKRLSVSPLLDEVLPHGQLGAADSPAGPHENQRALAAQRPELKGMSIQRTQRHVGQRITHSGPMGGVRCDGGVVHEAGPPGGLVEPWLCTSYSTDRSTMPRTSTARERLIDSACQLVHTRSYAATSVEDLCTAAGVQKGSFYHFFPTKHDLVLAAIDRQWATARSEILEPAFAPDASAAAALRSFLCAGG